MSDYNLHGKRMRVTRTARQGVGGEKTLFGFSQDGDCVWASYAGGRIERGCLFGTLRNGELRFRYLQQRRDCAVESGESRCDLRVLDDGRLCLVEHFTSDSGHEQGSNVFEEIPVGAQPGASAAPANIQSVQPVLMSRDVRRSIEFYETLGFQALFRDDENDPRYAGVGRDGAELHLQWHESGQWVRGQDRPTTRFLVKDPDELFRACPADVTGGSIRPVFDTAWGTRELHVRDPDGNGLQFYRPS